MSEWTCQYSLTTHFPGGINCENLQLEINTQVPEVTIYCSNAGLFTNSTTGESFVNLTFLADLTEQDPDQQPILEAWFPSHNPVAKRNKPLLREDGALYATPKAGGIGREMCDRDFKLSTCILGAGSVEDLYINTFTKKEESWGEMMPIGVYKDVGGVMTLCATQEEANAEGIMTEWCYFATDPHDNKIQWEIKDGEFYVDPELPYDERFAHKVYATFAPAIPNSLQGCVAVFDGYLGAQPVAKMGDDPERWCYAPVAALSPQASVLDPTKAPGGVSAHLSVCVFHPAGSKKNHVLRMVMFRDKGTFRSEPPSP